MPSGTEIQSLSSRLKALGHSGCARVGGALAASFDALLDVDRIGADNDCGFGNDARLVFEARARLLPDPHWHRPAYVHRR